MLKRRIALTARLFAPVAFVALAACSIKPGDISIDLPDTPVAAGARTSLDVNTHDSPFFSAKSSDPAVLTVTGVEESGMSVDVIGGKPGTVTLTVFDAADRQMGQRTVQVQATTAIALDQGVSPSGTSVLTGQTYGVHATTIGAGNTVLVGDGAIHFAYQGAATAGGDPTLCFGDCGTFTPKTAGDGAVVMTATSATTTLAIHAVDLPAIDSITTTQPHLDLVANEASGLAYTLHAGSAIVYGSIPCASADYDTVNVVNDEGGLLGNGAGGSATLFAKKPGSTNVTCSINGHTATFDVTVKSAP